MGLGFTHVVILAPIHRLNFFGIGGIRLLWETFGRLRWPSPVGFRIGFIGMGGSSLGRRVIDSTVL